MTTGHSHNWRDKCYGRKELQTKLREAYGHAVAGNPQFVVLKGMTGAGKTRLAQELYRWLSVEVDKGSEQHPQGYWPDFIISEATKDRVNPIFDQRERPEIPFLWLGMKFDEPAPVPTNASPEVIQQLATADSGKALRDALPQLMPHAVQAMVKRDVREVHGDWFWKAFNLGMMGVGMIPGVGLLANIPGWIKMKRPIPCTGRVLCVSLSFETSKKLAGPRLPHFTQTKTVNVTDCSYSETVKVS